VIFFLKIVALFFFSFSKKGDKIVDLGDFLHKKGDIFRPFFERKKSWSLKIFLETY
jgi:hypothetical protein